MQLMRLFSKGVTVENGTINLEGTTVNFGE